MWSGRVGEPPKNSEPPLDSKLAPVARCAHHLRAHTSSGVYLNWCMYELNGRSIFTESVYLLLIISADQINFESHHFPFLTQVSESPPMMASLLMNCADSTNHCAASALVVGYIVKFWLYTVVKFVT